MLLSDSVEVKTRRDNPRASMYDSGHLALDSILCDAMGYEIVTAEEPLCVVGYEHILFISSTVRDFFFAMRPRPSTLNQLK